MILVSGLTKSFRVPEKKAGWKASLSALFQRSYIEKKALDSIDLEVKRGEILGLLGANGAGKTTLVKCLSGIIAPTLGNVSVLGHHPWQRSIAFRHQLALVMGQKAQLWWDLPGEDSFLLLREIYQIPKDQYALDLNYLLDVLQAHHFLRTPLRRLSLGERMKMELVGALLHRPQVIFLDEPTIGLDFTAQKAIRRFILDYRNRYHPIIILTSHYMEDIEFLCERIVILRDGKKIYDGPLKEVQGDLGAFKQVEIHLKDGTLSDHEALILLKSAVKKANPSETSDETELLPRAQVQSGHVTFQIRAHLLEKVLSEIFASFPIHDFTVSNADCSEQIERLMQVKHI